VTTSGEGDRSVIQVDPRVKVCDESLKALPRLGGTKQARSPRGVADANGRGCGGQFGVTKHVVTPRNSLKNGSTRRLRTGPAIRCHPLDDRLDRRPVAARVSALHVLD
jgi:hypothetical protein